eukprot:scaffold49048_cov34-Tisochrysis_lutea.AAC.4
MWSSPFNSVRCAAPTVNEVKGRRFLLAPFFPSAICALPTPPPPHPAPREPSPRPPRRRSARLGACAAGSRTLVRRWPWRGTLVP